jgi:hypothetical protein
MSLKNDIRNVERNLERALNNVELESIKAVNDSVLSIQKNARRFAPAVTSLLRQRIRTRVSFKKGIISGWIGSIGVKYAPYVEFGTGDHVKVPTELKEEALKHKGTKKVRGMSPRPFMYPAFFLERRRFLDKMKKLVKNAKP